MKSTGGLKKHMNLYMSQIIQQIFLTRMQPKQDILMSEEDDNASDSFRFYQDDESISEAQDIEGYYRDLLGESSETRSRARVRHISQDGLLGSELLSSLKKVRLSK